MAVGVARTGVPVNVGDAENTKLVEVVPVAPDAVKPVMLLKHVMVAVEQLVPPLATASGVPSVNDAAVTTPAPVTRNALAGPSKKFPLIV